MHLFYEVIYKRIVQVVLFILALIVIVAFYALGSYVLKTGNYIIPLILVGTLLAVVLSSYIYVILMLPITMYAQFDKIKNKVALKQYQDINHFQEDIAKFTVGFFKSGGINIESGLFHFKYGEKFFCQMEEFGFNIADYPDVKNRTVIKIKANNKNAYLIKVSLDVHDLGYMVLFPKGFVLPFFDAILTDYKNNCIDDQLMHVINYTIDK